MNIFELLEEEHHKIRDIVDTLDRMPTKACTQGFETFGQLRDELQAHMRTEEDVLYSVLWHEASVKGSVGDSEQEHHAIDLLLEELENIPMDSRSWETKYGVLKEILEEHFRHEEEVLFADAERLFAGRGASRRSELLGGPREGAHLFAD